jgi:hypothetical protein
MAAAEAEYPPRVVPILEIATGVRWFQRAMSTTVDHDGFNGNSAFENLLILPLVTDDTRDLNDHAENDLKRQRSNYNGDQLYSNVSIQEAEKRSIIRE